MSVVTRVSGTCTIHRYFKFKIELVHNNLGCKLVLKLKFLATLKGLNYGAINISNVGKIYPNGTRALEDVNIEINDGEFVVLVGPSGCGKTTLLRMVAGLEDITEGEISIADNVVNEVAPKDRDIAMVFQNYALYPHMSVYDNMAFSLKLRKLSKEEIDKKVKEAAKTLEIDELLDRNQKPYLVVKDKE